MISFISNSKAFWRYTAVIVATALVLCAFERFVRQYESIDWYRIRTEIDAQKPDIILIGNSMLQTHVNRPAFEKRLSELAGRPIKAYFISKAGCGMATFYLILKYQVAGSHLSGIPVGIVDFDASNFLSIGQDGTERGQIKTFMPVNDPYFLSHYYDGSLAVRAALRGFCQSCYFSPEFSREAITAAALDALKRLKIGGDPATDIKARFARLARDPLGHAGFQDVHSHHPSCAL